MSFYRKVRSRLAHQLRGLRYRRVFAQYRDFTMIPRETYVDNLRLARQVSNVDGCVVECGVWRGGMIAGISSVLGPDRDYFLFDSFEGLPPAKAVDGEAALQWQKDTQSPGYYDNCSAGEEFAKRAMDHAGVKSFHLVKGWFDETLPAFTPAKPIALLRLDGDWYDSTMVCLESLFHHVTPGGLIILDDYYAWDGCTRALHDFLSRRSAVERIRNLGEVCYLRKVENTEGPTLSQPAITRVPDRTNLE